MVWQTNQCPYNSLFSLLIGIYYYCFRNIVIIGTEVWQAAIKQKAEGIEGIFEYE